MARRMRPHRRQRSYLGTDGEGAWTDSGGRRLYIGPTPTRGTATMTYAGDRRIIDVDSHLFELDDFLAAVATDDEAAHIRPMDEQTELPVSLEAIERGREYLRRRNDDAEVMAQFESTMFDIGRNPWSRLGAFDPADRSHALDVLGFERQIVLGTFSFHQIAHTDDAAALEVGARVHNRAMGRFCSHDDRLLAGGYVPLSLGPEVAGSLVDDAFADGCYTVMVDTNEANPEARSFTHPDFDHVWARFAARDVPVILHIAVNGHYDPVSPSFKNNGRGAGPPSAATPPTPTSALVAMNNSVELFLSAMILDEVFERHDGLRCLSLEHGASWVPAGCASSISWSGRLGELRRGNDQRRTSLAAGAVRAVRREDVGWLIDQLGTDMLCFASDYPHPEGSNDPIRRFEATMGDVSAEAMESFYAGTIERFLGAT